MSVVHSSQAAITSSVNSLYYDCGYAQKQIQILLNAANANLSDPNALAQIEGAYSFFEALKNSQAYRTPDGKVMDFSVFGTGGLFGDKSAQFETLVDQALQSYNSIKMPDPKGENVTVYDQTTGQPATLFDLITHPTNQFSFNFNMNHGDSNDKLNWCRNPNNQEAYPDYLVGDITNTSSSWKMTQDNAGNPIPGGGLNITDNIDSCYKGSTNHYTVSGSGAAIENYCSIGTSDSQAAGKNIDALDAFLTANM